MVKEEKRFNCVPLHFADNFRGNLCQNLTAHGDEAESAARSILIDGLREQRRRYSEDGRHLEQVVATLHHPCCRGRNGAVGIGRGALFKEASGARQEDSHLSDVDLCLCPEEDRSGDWDQPACEARPTDFVSLVTWEKRKIFYGGIRRESPGRDPRRKACCE